MQNLPIGIQEFSEFKAGDYIYIDKTEHIYKLLKNKYYFLSRPRRFGKSLLLNTIKEIFKGNKELFEGLWIYDKIKWEKYQVIKISFSGLGYENVGLPVAIEDKLDNLANEHNINLKGISYSHKFDELIKKLAGTKQVVILVDEYDKPIIDYIDDLSQAEANRKVLKSFYSVIKDNDENIRFFFVTGVSKFSQVSIFSDLNNLNDITLDENYSTITGYTQDELEGNFSEYLESVAQRFQGIFDNINNEIKKWYNGYSWDGKNFVYNPFSMLNFLSKRMFNDYWFATGTPTFLMKLIKQNEYTVFDLKNRMISLGDLNKYEITSISLIPLLFQTGYLTIKQIDIREMTLLLDFPNAEVERAFTIHLLASFNDGQIDKTSTLLNDIKDCLKQNRIDKFIELVNILFKGISYILVDNKEKYFHSLFYMIVKLLGFTIESEIMTIDGRIDAAVMTDDYVYIIEFKTGQNAETALNQIKEMEYHLKYVTDKRKKILMGINFNIDKKQVDDYITEVF